MSVQKYWQLPATDPVLLDTEEFIGHVETTPDRCSEEKAEETEEAGWSRLAYPEP